MERYHIFKLGLAILFYAVYCIRPMMVDGLEADDTTTAKNVTTTPNPDNYLVYYQGVEGTPGVDFPVFSYIPRTGFTCKGMDSGYYADLDTDCQVFHICEEGKKISFLCPNGTIFQQSDLICEWWFKVNCTNSPNLYDESAEHLQLDIARRKASRRVYLNGQERPHGAVMRTEEASSVTASKNGKHYEVRVHQKQQLRGGKRIIGKTSSNHNQIQDTKFATTENENQPSAIRVQQQSDHQQVNELQQTQDYLSSTSASKTLNEVPQQNYKINSGNVNVQNRNNFGQNSHKNINRGGVKYSSNEYQHQQNSNNQNLPSSDLVQSNKYATKDHHGQQITNGEIQSQTPTNNDEFNTNYEGTNGNTQNQQYQNYQQTDRQQENQNNHPQEQYDNQQNHQNVRQENVDFRITQNIPQQQHHQPQNHQNTQQQNVDYKITQNIPQQNTQQQSADFKITQNIPQQNHQNTQQQTEDFKISQNIPQQQHDHPRNDQNAPQQNIDFKLSESPKEQLEFPLHESEISKSKKLTFDAKGDVQQKSTVALTRNDITNRRLEPTESEESQIPQETASFYKNNFNNIQDNYNKASSPNPYPNHRTTYSDLRQPVIYYNNNNNKQVSKISSVTPQYITTQSINNGKPFIGSRVGSTIQSTHPTTQSNTLVESTTKGSVFSNNKQKSTIILAVTRHSNPTSAPNTVGTTTAPVSQFGFTDSPTSTSTFGGFSSVTTPQSTRTSKSFELFSNSFTRRGSNGFSTFSSTTQPSNFKFASSVNSILPYSTLQPPIDVSISDEQESTVRVGSLSSTIQPPIEISTKKVIDHATVYGTFVKSTPTTPSPPVTSSQGVAVRFNKNSNKIGVQLSKSFGANLPPIPKVNPEIHINDVQSTIGPTFENKKSTVRSGFFVTKNSEYGPSTVSPSISSSSPENFGTSSSTYFGSNKETVRPRPFQRSQDFTSNLDNHGFIISRFTGKENKASNLQPLTTPSYKISSASPFMVAKETTPAPTLPTPYVSSTTAQFNSVYENVDNMINVLMEIANVEDNQKDHSAETPRPGLVIPPSAGPQTLHTLAVYFANALDGIASEKDKLKGKTAAELRENKEKLTTLLTQMTRNHYEELFKKNQNKNNNKQHVETTTSLASRSSIEDDDNGLEAQHSKNLVQSPQIRQLARNFSIALSSYLDDPATFRKDLENFRPTEPPPISGSDDANETGNGEEELLNFSDADAKSSYPPIFPTVPSVSPTWGYILAYNTSKQNNLDVKNSLNPDLQGADTQSFVPKFNSVSSNSQKEVEKNENEKQKADLPADHWTASPNATKLWRTTFSVNPVHFNGHFGTTEPIVARETDSSTEEITVNEDFSAALDTPQREIQYELRTLPKLSLNSTQVHGILIDFMNTTKTDDSNRLQRILRKLNTTEDEFLNKMKEIETNPLTKRLILLLISECGANVTKDVENLANANNREILQQASSNSAVSSRQVIENKPLIKSSSRIKEYVDPKLEDHDEDARALQLLNSLYSIASRFGK